MSRPLLIDADPGCDDAVAIAMAAGDESLDIVGMSTVHGNGTVEDTTRNALAICDEVGLDDVPVAKGCDRPLRVELETGEAIHGEGGIKGEVSPPTRDPVDLHAAAFIVEMAREYPGELVLAPLGPLTNVAVALALEPELPDLIDETVVMGGAAYTAGNVTPLAEANIYHDPEAADRVVADLSPSLVGLDVTVEATIDPDRRSKLPETPLRPLLQTWLDYYPDWLIERYDIEATLMHDAVVIATLVDDEVVRFEESPLSVLTGDGPHRGKVVPDPYESGEFDGDGRVAVDIDPDRFNELLFERLATLPL